jgi:diadenosine tetraphosphatase ApaH/serine/threonine PP2A family protein phosphatase
MRTLIVSDVHSNLPALEAVIRHAEAAGAIHAIWCMGDITGYGAQPNETIAALRAHPITAVAGNHDLAAIGRMPDDEFNRIAAEAVRWTSTVLDAEARAFLESLPLVATTGAGDAAFTLVHGSLRAPEWEYLLEPEQAVAQFERQTTPYSFIGHSHLTFYVTDEAGARMPRFHQAADGQTIALGEQRLIINPGSAGQPRDGDPRAAYVLYDDRARTITWHRVEYDINAAQDRIHAAGLPAFLAERLAAGQ